MPPDAVKETPAPNAKGGDPIVKTDAAAAKPAPEKVNGKAAAAPPPETVAPVEPDLSPKEMDRWAREQQKIRQARRALDSERSSMQGQLTAFQRQMQEMHQQNQQLARELEHARRDPLSYAKAHGMEPDKTIKEWLDGSTPEKLIAGLEQKINDRFSALDREREELRAREVGSQERAVISSVAGHIVSSPKEYRYLNILYDQDDIAAQIHAIHEEGKRRGAMYGAGEVANYLESRAKARYENSRRREQRLSGQESELGDLTPEQPAKNGDGRQANGPGSSQAGRLAAGKGSERRSPPREATDDEKDAWALSELRAARLRDNAQK